MTPKLKERKAKQACSSYDNGGEGKAIMLTMMLKESAAKKACSPHGIVGEGKKGCSLCGIGGGVR